MGVSLAVGLGNGLDVTAADVLDHLAGDSATAAVALRLESVGDGRALVGAVERLARSTPVVALIAGPDRPDDFARSRTGALATSWRTARAALRQAGAVVVDDERQLSSLLPPLTYQRNPVDTGRPTESFAGVLATVGAEPGRALRARRARGARPRGGRTPGRAGRPPAALIALDAVVTLPDRNGHAPADR